MKSNIKSIVLFSFLLFTVNACIQKSADYSVFPQKCVIKGLLNNGNTLFLICDNDSSAMSGMGFFENGKAIVYPFSFIAKTDGTGVLLFNEEIVKINLSTDVHTSTLIIHLPAIEKFRIKKQDISLTITEKVTDNIHISERYKSPVFEQIKSIDDIQYGNAVGFYNSKPIDKIPNDDYVAIFNEISEGYTKHIISEGMSELPLFLDVYTPVQDSITKRPVFLFIHGGSFIFGDKKNKLQQVLTEQLVKRGYVVASINYRLGTTFWGGDAIKRAVYRSTQDTRAAIRYLIHHSEDFGIDSDQIYIGGNSAGGITALTTTFMDEHEVFDCYDEKSYLGGLLKRSDLGKLDESGNELNEQVKIAGVISLWGALIDMKIIDNFIPTLLFHGTEDDIVRHDEGLPFKNQIGAFLHNQIARNWKFYGSASINKYMNSYNLPVTYIPFEGYGHEPQVEADGSYNQNMDIVNEKIISFLYQHVSEHYLKCGIEGAMSVSASDKPPVYSIRNNDLKIIWQIEGGEIIHRSGNAIKVVWYGTTKKGLILAYVQDKNKVWFKLEKNVVIK